jgi:hypothetical protein
VAAPDAEGIAWAQVLWSLFDCPSALGLPIERAVPPAPDMAPHTRSNGAFMPVERTGTMEPHGSGGRRDAGEPGERAGIRAGWLGRRGRPRRPGPMTWPIMWFRQAAASVPGSVAELRYLPSRTRTSRFLSPPIGWPEHCHQTVRPAWAAVSFPASFHGPRPDRLSHAWPDSTADLTCEHPTRQAAPDWAHTPPKQQVPGSSPPQLPKP